MDKCAGNKIEKMSSELIKTMWITILKLINSDYIITNLIISKHSAQKLFETITVDIPTNILFLHNINSGA